MDITKEFLEMTYPDEYYKNVIQPAKMGTGPVPSKAKMLWKSQPIKATTMQLQNLFSPGKYDAFRARGTPAASKVLGGLGKGLGYLASLPAQAALMTLHSTPANADEINMTAEDYQNLYAQDQRAQRFKQQQLMNRRKQQMQQTIRQHEAAQAAQATQQVQQVQQNIQTYGNRDRPNTGMNVPGGGKRQSPTGGDVAGTPFVRGGRASYFDGGLLSLWPR
jgi:hypothetical protein